LGVAREIVAWERRRKPSLRGEGEGGGRNGFAGVQAVGGGFDGADDAGVAPAAAEGVFKSVTNILLASLRILAQESMSRHDLPRDAETALHGAMRHKCLLERM
jgi:hypothetical protein